MAALATVPELLARMGVSQESLSAEDTVRAEAALADVSSLVREEARQEWATPEVTPEAVRAVVLAAARRVYSNPEGFTSETAGPFTVRRDTVGAYLTEQETAIVRRYRPAGSQTGGLWTQPTTRGEVYDGVGYVWDQFGTEPIPYYDDVR